MDEAGQDWAQAGASALQDGELASFCAGGALMLWDAAAQAPVLLDSGAQALLGRGAASFPAPTRQRLTLLAGGLASRDAVRLERLRLTAGFSAALVTCGCKLLALPGGGTALAIAVPAGEMRRLGVVLPKTAPVAAMPEPAETAPVPEAVAEPPRSMPQRASLRLLWTSDAEGRLTSLAPDAPELAGFDPAAALVGRRWSDILDEHAIDPDGGLAQRLAARTTWSGQRLLWRSASSDEGVRVEISGAPVLDSSRQFVGFRGFALARLTEREALPARQEAAMPIEAELAETAGPVVEIGERESDAEATPSAVDAPAVTPDESNVAISPEAGETALTPLDLEQPASVTTTHSEPEAAATEAEAELEDDAPDSEHDGAAEADDVPEDTAAVLPEIEATEQISSAATDAPAATESDPLPKSAPAAPAPGANIFPLRNGHLTAVRPVLEPGKPHLSSAERNAFREIAKALGARIAGEDEIGPRLPPVAPLRLKELAEGTSAKAPEPAIAKPAEAPAADATDAETAETQRQRLPNSHADVLDRLPIAVLVNRGDEALYANRTLLDLLDYADLDDLKAGGTVSRLIKEAARTDGGAMVLIDRTGHLVAVNAVLSSVSWLNEPATLMAFRNAEPGGEVKVMTPEEAEEAELAAEFAAEEAESGARVEALRLDVDARETRIGELTAMLDTATDGVVTIDERGRMLSLNKAAEALFGYDQREVTGELFTLLFAAESHAPALDYLEGLKGGGVASVMNDGREVMGRVRQGGRIPLFMTMGQIAHGADRRFCAVLRDITAWKKTEGELVEARKAAEKASAQKSDVLAKISHEIRTPLNAIIGFAEVMAEERFGPIANERYKEYLRDIHASGGYVISLVNDLLDLAKIEAGKLDLDFVSVSLNEIALSAVALLQPEAQRGRVVLRSGLSPKLPPVVADERSLRQIVLNLLSNAVKFTDAGGQVIVSTALGDHGEAILRVRDTGIGMDDNEIALALEPFRQVPTTRRKGGTGLGLPLTKALVEANRAAMAITSVKKEGTLVEITFPPQRVLAG
jgi:PAS domain S-box-containing protein